MGIKTQPWIGHDNTIVINSEYVPGWDSDTSCTLTVGMGGGIGSPRSYNPTTQPRKHIAHCNRCGVSSMIPDSTEKIMALLCPQCGGALDA